MADTKISALTELTSPDTGGGDRMPIVDDPTGTPVTKYITTRNLFKSTLTKDKWIYAHEFVTTPTKPAALNTATYSATGNVAVKTADFDDGVGVTFETTGFWWHPPETWDAGTVSFAVVWTNAGGAAAETIDFDLAGYSYADNDALDLASGTAQNATDIWNAQNDVHISAFSSAITLGGTPAQGQPNYFVLTRDTATDTLTGDCQVIAVILRYGTTDQGTA